MVEIYYDGIHIEKYPEVKGFTTNCTLMSGLGMSYKEFYESKKDVIKGRPLSFQIWEDETDKAITQIEQIHSIDPALFVKIPIVNSAGKLNTELFQFCVQREIPVNVTALYTFDQILSAYNLVHMSKAPCIISVFAGPISDLSIDPDPIVRYATSIFKGTTSKVLWAGCREVYSAIRAYKSGCDIITVPDGVIERIGIVSTLEQLSIERVQKFKRDALKGPITIV
jgi:transaldolase